MLLPAAALVDAEADGDEDGGSDLPAPAFADVVLPLGLALACGVAVAECDVVAEAEGLALPVVGVDVPQIVGNGNVGEPPAAIAGVARASAPATATKAIGAPTATRTRRDGPSALRAFGGSGTGDLHFRKVDGRRLLERCRSRPGRFGSGCFGFARA